MAWEEIAQRVLNKVLEKDAVGDLIIDEGESLSLSAQEGELDEYKISSSQVFGIRVIKDNRIGTAYSEASDDEALVAMLDQALTNASYAAEDEHETIQNIKDTLSTDDDFFCPEDTSTVEEKIDTILRMESALLEQKNIKNVPYNGIQSGKGSRYLFSTSGLTARSSAKNNVCYAHALMEDGEYDVMEGSGQASRVFREIDSSALIEDVYQRCSDILRGKPVESKRYDVIFDENVNPIYSAYLRLCFQGNLLRMG